MNCMVFMNLMNIMDLRSDQQEQQQLHELLVVLVDGPTSNEHEWLEDENNDITKKAGTLVHKEPDK